MASDEKKSKSQLLKELKSVREKLKKNEILKGKREALKEELIDNEKNAEIALRESENKYRNLVENINDVIFTTDSEGIITYISPVIKSILGYTPKEVIGHNYLEFIYNEDIPYILEIFPQVLEGKLRPSEYRIRAKSGEICWVRTYSRPIIENKRSIGLQGVLTDITERKLVENKLKENEDFLETIFNSAKIGLALVDKNGVIIKTNKRLHDVSGFSFKELKGKEITSLNMFPQKSLTKLLHGFERILKKKQTEQIEVEVKTKKGEDKIVEIVGTPVLKNGKFDGVVASLRDITEWKYADEAIRKSEEKFRLISQNIPVAVYSALPDEHSTSLFISGRIEEILGYSAEELIKDPEAFTMIVHPDDRKFVWKKIEEHRRKKTVLDIEYRIYTKDKKLKWIRDKATPVLDRKKRLIRIDGFIEDVTKRKQTEGALIESEEKFSKAFHTSPDAILLTNLESGEIIEVNKGFENNSGYSRKEVIGSTTTALNLWQDPKERSKIADMIKKGKVIKDMEINFKRKSGENWIGLLTIGIIEINNEMHAISIARDITERKQTEEALIESEEKYRNLIENINEVIYSVNEDGVITYISPIVESIVGLSPMDIIGKNFGELIFPDDLPKSQIEFQKVLSGHDTTNEYRFFTKSGEIRWLNTSNHPIFEGDKILGASGVLTDITDRKHAEEAVYESEERFRGFAERSSEIIFMVDIDGINSYVSPSIQNYMGYRPNEFIGKPFYQYLIESEIPKVNQAFQRLSAGKDINNFELKINDKRGSLHYLEINATPTIKDGKIDGFQGIARDITERKQNEEELKRRLMRFKLEEGGLYLIQETVLANSLEAISDLTMVGYPGIIFSRSPVKKLKSLFDGDIEFYWLSEKKGEGSIKPTPSLIEQKIEELDEKKFIFLDGLNYLISKNNFNKVLSFVQHLWELAIISNHIIIITIDPSLVDSHQLKLLEKETQSIEPLRKPKLSEELLEILKFIFEQNISGIKPSHTNIRRELRISKPTARKRINKLISAGHIVEHPKGRIKVLEITDRGRNIFL